MLFILSLYLSWYDLHKVHTYMVWFTYIYKSSKIIQLRNKELGFQLRQTVGNSALCWLLPAKYLEDTLGQFWIQLPPAEGVNLFLSLPTLEYLWEWKDGIMQTPLLPCLLCFLHSFTLHYWNARANCKDAMESAESSKKLLAEECFNFSDQAFWLIYISLAV